MKLLERAEYLATILHINQERKTGGPYITHPRAVAEIVKNHSDIVRAAAWLHDTIEDCGVTEYELLDLLTSEACGTEGSLDWKRRNEISMEDAIKTVALVKELTNVYTKEAFPRENRLTRKIFEMSRLEGISADAQTIKVADIIDNSKDLDKLGGFGPKYLTECEDKLSVLTRADENLIARATKQLESYGPEFRKRS